MAQRTLGARRGAVRGVLPIGVLPIGTLLVGAALALILAACGAGSDPPAPPASGAAAARAPAPSLDPGLTWQWQLQGTLNTGYAVDLYDVDLFETSAATVAALRLEGRLVLCYFSAGSGEEWRPDYARLPAAGLGEPLEGWEGERWLDIRAAGVRAVLAERLALAAARGCDGVEPDNVTAWENASGFPIGEAEQIEFNRWLASEAHARGLLIALKNAGALAGALVDDFDLALNEECHAFDECDEFRPFLRAAKSVLNVEYAADAAAAAALAGAVCPGAQALGLRTLILPLALDDEFRVACD